MSWKEYTLALLLFNVLGSGGIRPPATAIWLPLNPMKFGPVTPDPAFNTAVSFATNTNWQSYGGETTMSYLTQMLGLAVQNFLSAATGLAAAAPSSAALPGQAAKGSRGALDGLVRTTLYILLPLPRSWPWPWYPKGSCKTSEPIMRFPCCSQRRMKSPSLMPRASHSRMQREIR